LSVAVPLIVGGPVPVLAAKAKSMLSSCVGNIVHSLESLVWRGKQRPSMIAAQLIEAINVDLRQTEVRRAGHPGVDAIDCRRIRSMVSSKNRLPEPLETEPRLIDPAGVGHPGVIETENLSPQSRLRFP